MEARRQALDQLRAENRHRVEQAENRPAQRLVPAEKGRLEAVAN